MGTRRVLSVGKTPCTCITPSLPLGSSLPESCLQPKHETCVCIFWEFCFRTAKLELASNLILFQSGKKPSHLTFALSPTASPIFTWPRGTNLFAEGLLTVSPGMLTDPCCFHSTWLQFAIISLQQLKDIGLLSHITFMSSFAQIWMDVTSIFFLDPYSKISNVSLQIYSPVSNTQRHLLLLLHMSISLEE